LIGWQRHGGQNTDDRHHDHQFDQGETLLHRTLHEKLLGVKKNEIRGTWCKWRASER